MLQKIQFSKNKGISILYMLQLSLLVKGQELPNFRFFPLYGRQPPQIPQGMRPLFVGG